MAPGVLYYRSEGGSDVSAGSSEPGVSTSSTSPETTTSSSSSSSSSSSAPPTTTPPPTTSSSSPTSTHTPPPTTTNAPPPPPGTTTTPPQNNDTPSYTPPANTPSDNQAPPADSSNPAVVSPPVSQQNTPFGDSTQAPGGTVVVGGSSPGALSYTSGAPSTNSSPALASDHTSNSNSSKIGVIAGCAIAGVAIIGLIVFFLSARIKKNRRNREAPSAEFMAVNTAFNSNSRAANYSAIASRDSLTPQTAEFKPVLPPTKERESYASYASSDYMHTTYQTNSFASSEYVLPPHTELEYTDLSFDKERDTSDANSARAL